MIGFPMFCGELTVCSTADFTDGFVLTGRCTAAMLPVFRILTGRTGTDMSASVMPFSSKTKASACISLEVFSLRCHIPPNHASMYIRWLYCLIDYRFLPPTAHLHLCCHKQIRYYNRSLSCRRKPTSRRLLSIGITVLCRIHRSSSQTAYPSLRRKRQNSLSALLLLSP